MKRFQESVDRSGASTEKKKKSLFGLSKGQLKEIGLRGLLILLLSFGSAGVARAQIGEEPSPNRDRSELSHINELFVDQILELIATGLVDLGESEPVFDGPINHQDLETWHLRRSTYSLGRFSTTNETWMVSYCAPIAIGMELALSDLGDPLAVARAIVTELGYGSSTRIMQTLGSQDEAQLNIGGVDFNIERWQLDESYVAEELDDLEVGDSTVLVMRDVGDTSKVGHLITVMRVSETQWVVVQSNETRGAFFDNGPAMRAASEHNASNGGVFVTIGDREGIANYVMRTAHWYYSTGIARMEPMAENHADDLTEESSTESPTTEVVGGLFLLAVPFKRRKAE